MWLVHHLLITHCIRVWKNKGIKVFIRSILDVILSFFTIAGEEHAVKNGFPIISFKAKRVAFESSLKQHALLHIGSKYWFETAEARCPSSLIATNLQWASWLHTAHVKIIHGLGQFFTFLSKFWAYNWEHNLGRLTNSAILTVKITSLKISKADIVGPESVMRRIWFEGNNLDLLQ